MKRYGKCYVALGFWIERLRAACAGVAQPIQLVAQPLDLGFGRFGPRSFGFGARGFGIGPGALGLRRNRYDASFRVNKRSQVHCRFKYSPGTGPIQASSISLHMRPCSSVVSGW
ncbi:MAG: hypothetical protein HC802_21610 [Caldilineaceae bacterium]|nr:hypothetical protein [Caldilineaceae bacterium]